jgi:hypothetical protein
MMIRLLKTAIPDIFEKSTGCQLGRQFHAGSEFWWGEP